MANDTPVSDEASKNESSFIGTSATSKVDTVYSDFFQETSDGKISVGSKAKKSGLETTTTILGYIIPIAVIAVVVASIHVFLRTQEKGGFAENYQFLCPYMNQGTDLNTEERGCKTLSVIKGEYTEKQKTLEEEILKKLNEYIPIKITNNLMQTSPEKKFIVQAYDTKVRVDIIMKQFEKVLRASQFRDKDNILCVGISIDNQGVLTTQCTIYGGAIGADESNGRIGSSRIEAMDFVKALSDSGKNQFILLNPPTALGSEEVDDDPLFKSRTTIPVQIRYISFDEKS